MLSTNGREQAQGSFATRERTNERGKGEKFRSKSRPLAERPSFKCGEVGHFKANFSNKRIIFDKHNNDIFKIVLLLLCLK